MIELLPASQEGVQFLSNERANKMLKNIADKAKAANKRRQVENRRRAIIMHELNKMKKAGW